MYTDQAAEEKSLDGKCMTLISIKQKASLLKLKTDPVTSSLVSGASTGPQ